jgi:hypothetical protein
MVEILAYNILAVISISSAFKHMMNPPVDHDTAIQACLEVAQN